MRYLPFLDGKYSVAPGLLPVSKLQGADRLLFQVDDEYSSYLENKAANRREDIHKYYARHQPDLEITKQANRFIVATLVQEHPDVFGYEVVGINHRLVNRKTAQKIEWSQDWLETKSPRYMDLFDALCSQVQEDLAICELQKATDRVSVIHLMAPNHWSPSEKIGKSFGDIHGIVPGMEKFNQHYSRILESILEKGPFTRFAWGIATDTRLNHHPLPPPGISESYWHGRQADETVDVFVRVERQVLNRILGASAFLFIIRTYFYAIDDLLPAEKNALASALQSMSPASLAYKGLTGKVESLVNRLSSP